MIKKSSSTFEREMKNPELKKAFDKSYKKSLIIEERFEKSQKEVFLNRSSNK